MCFFQGLGKVQKENARKGLPFFFPLACLSLFARQRNRAILKGNGVFFPPALPPAQLEPSGVAGPGPLLHQGVRWEPHVPPP